MRREFPILPVGEGYESVGRTVGFIPLFSVDFLAAGVGFSGDAATRPPFAKKSSTKLDFFMQSWIPASVMSHSGSSQAGLEIFDSNCKFQRLPRHIYKFQGALLGENFTREPKEPPLEPQMFV